MGQIQKVDVERVVNETVGVHVGAGDPGKAASFLQYGREGNFRTRRVQDFHGIRGSSDPDKKLFAGRLMKKLSGKGTNPPDDSYDI